MEKDGPGATTPTTALLSSVESFPGGVVAVGQSGTILISADGASWKARSAPTTNWIYRVRYANGQLVAVGQGGSLLQALTDRRGLNAIRHFQLVDRCSVD